MKCAEQMNFFDNYPIIEDEQMILNAGKCDNARVLWNGEYEEHDLSHISGLEGIQRNQAKIYPQYIGITIGDFTVINVEYDWGKRDQRWTIKCNLCGEESYRYHTADWRRGKGGKTYCHCRKDTEVQKREERKLARELSITEEIGKAYGRYKVIEYKGYDACKVKCEICGATRRTGVTISNLKQGIYPKCDCDKPGYNDPKYIGMRVGHLVVERHDGHYFVCKCDCGKYRNVIDTYFARKRYYDCGRSDCKYISERKMDALKARLRGGTYETIASALIESFGYSVKLTGKTGDFGVDIIATGQDGEKIAVQCKSNMKATTGVAAIQQVYAGGRYYGLEHFAVISHGGYSVNAVKMAKKLGVYLSDGQTFKYPNELKKYANELIPTIKAKKNMKRQKLYEIDGCEKTLANIAFENAINEDSIRKGLRKGLSIENAVKYAKDKKSAKIYTVHDITGSISQLCYHFRVVTPECASYRIKRGWSIEDAILTEKQQGGRPKKKSEKEGQIRMAI